MQVVNKKMCVIVILVLVIIESCTLFLMYKSYSNKNTNLDEVNLNISNTNMFAIMLEQEDGTYKEDTSSTWPTSGYTYNASMSGCIDLNGNKLDGVLSYDATNNIATVDTGNTSYCYLYFSLPPNLYDVCERYDKMSSCVATENMSQIGGMNSIEAGMYRYQGTADNVTNNYLCFGTTIKSECVGNTDKYMYRIIGIQENGQIKLIKKEALNTSYQWYSDYETNNTWPNSLIKSSINGSSFLTNTTYVPTGWESKIVTYGWKYGDTTSNGNMDGPTIYAIENAWTNTVSAKVGLMYIHDYYYAYASGGAPGNYNNAMAAWIHLSKNDTSTPTPYDWTMVRYGYFSGHYFAWYVNPDGSVGRQNLNLTRSVRPVFYLTSDVEITGGTGTIDDPFIIN